MKIAYALFDTLLEPTFVLNAELKVVYCNEPAALVVGHTIRKVTRGMKFPELFTFSDEIPGLKDIINVCDATPYKEVTFTTPQGGEGKVQITMQPIFDSMGDKNWIVFVRDVTLEERLQGKYRKEIEQKEDVIKALEDAKIQLENYSKNLEVMVADRTRELSSLNQTMAALLDSLGQGFFIFGADGKVFDVTSKACEATIEGRPQGKQIWDVLKLPENKVEGFQKWMQTLFMEMLPFEDLSPLGPTSYPHSEGRHIALEYHPLRTAEGTMEGVVVVASDITSLVEAQRLAEAEKQHAKLIINMIKGKREIRRFIQEAQGMIEAIHAEVTANDEGEFDRENLFRQLHTLKGGAALFSVKKVAERSHEAENILSELNRNFSHAGFIALRGKCFEIEEAYQQFLAETKEILGSSAMTEERQIEVAITTLNHIARKVGTLPGGGPVAQDLILELVMEPVSSFVEPYNDVILGLSAKLEKNVAPLEVTNGSIMVVPEIYNNLFATLVHAFRNAIDHGIETPGWRAQNGKSEEGHISIDFAMSFNKTLPYLTIKIQDDGQGINPERIREKLKSLGVDANQESDQEVIQHIFDSQFSTRSEVTDISGRGVGMDAIKNAADLLAGRTWVESKMGSGTCVCIQVPYLTEFDAALRKIPKAA